MHIFLKRTVCFLTIFLITNKNKRKNDVILKTLINSMSSYSIKVYTKLILKFFTSTLSKIKLSFILLYSSINGFISTNFVF